METNTIILLKKVLADGFQVEPEAFKLIESTDENEIDLEKSLHNIIEKKIKEKEAKIITKYDIISFLPPQNKIEFNESKIDIKIMLEIISDIGSSFIPSQGKKGFQELFTSRYNKLLKIVSARPNYHNIEKIISLKKNVKEKVRRTAGLVMNKKIRQNNVTITIDDGTGMIEVIALDKRSINEAKKVLLDSFIIVDLIFSKTNTAILKAIFLPDIPEHKPVLSKEQVYAIFTSDLHIGSRSFLNKEFSSFINWLNNKESDQIVNRIKYIVIAGDAVDGIGIYPNQEQELIEYNLQNQYIKLAEFLKMIPKSIEIIITPGNHDPVRQALPQPPIPREYAGDLYEMDNVTLLGNPAYVRLHNVNVLIYHGRSLDDVIATVPGFTFDNPAQVMKLLLKCRHLSPIYGGRSSILPGTEDHLVITSVPDIFHSGHVHVLGSDNYRGTLILNSGSWQSQTPFQAKMGIIPVAGIVPIVNLSTLEILAKSFKLDKK